MTPTLAFIGAGRIASALAVRFYSTGYTITGIYSRSSAEVLARRVNSRVSPPYPTADIIFLTVPDDAIAAAAASLAEHHPTGAVVHTSGVHSLDVLNELPEVGSFHPVYPFREGTQLRGDEGMLVGIEASSDTLRQQLIDLAQVIGGHPAVLKPGKKARYHAAAAIASNYLVTLFDISLQLMTEAGVSIDDGRRAILNLMQGNLDNLRQMPPHAALTGPIARGDIVTIQKHLSALEGSPYLQLYRELGQHTTQLAPDLSAEVRQKLLEML